MTQTLNQLISNLQALLLGDSTTFSTATCTAAIRSALKELNFTVPSHAAELQDSVTDQYEYELADQNALSVTDVLLEGTDTYQQYNVPLPFDWYFEDDRPYIRLQTPLGSNQTLIIRYTLPYTIYGLDSATDSTLPAIYDTVLLDGAAWIACLIRAAGRVETINMNQDVPASFERMADHFHESFLNGMDKLKRRRPAVSQQPSHGWDDEWQGQF